MSKIEQSYRPKSKEIVKSSNVAKYTPPKKIESPIDKKQSLSENNIKKIVNNPSIYPSSVKKGDVSPVLSSPILRQNSGSSLSGFWNFLKSLFGGKEKITQNSPYFRESGEKVQTQGKITTYQQYGDKTPDIYSSQAIGAFSRKYGKLKYGDLAVSRDIEAQFKRQGIKPGEEIALTLSDGSTLKTRWMDRTSKDLSGRFDIFQRTGNHQKDDTQVVGFSKVV